MKCKPVYFSYHKCSNMWVPILLSSCDYTIIFAYSSNQFTKFSPHDFFPAPQRVPVHFVQSSAFNKMPLLLVQSSNGVDIMSLKLGNGAALDKAPGGPATTNLLVRVNRKGSGKITCSTISPCGSLFCFSNHVKPSMFELKRTEGSKTAWLVNKRHLPGKLPYAHALCFTTDSSRLIIAGGDRRIYVCIFFSSLILFLHTLLWSCFSRGILLFGACYVSIEHVEDLFKLENKGSQALLSILTYDAILKIIYCW